MPTDHEILERTVVDGLRATRATPLGFAPSLEVRSFVLEREQGDAVVYHSPGLAEAAPDLRAGGPPALWLVNHAHEAMFEAADLGIGAHIHELEREDSAGLPIAATFSERHRIAADLEAIPTPGHTAGATAYLWDGGGHRTLFTGDSLLARADGWRAAVLASSDRAAYLDSLRLLREVDFDALASWASPVGADPVVLVAPGEARERLDAVIARVEAGGDG